MKKKFFAFISLLLLLFIYAPLSAEASLMASLRADIIEYQDAEAGILLIGKRSGLWDSESLYCELASSLASIDADIIEGVCENNFISISGYCSAFGRAVICDDRKINIQLAASYSEEAGSIYFYLGRPLIYADY